MPIGTHTKNFNLFVDGESYAGEVEEFNKPKLVKKMEEWRAGGMDGPIEIDMGIEKLEADFTMSGDAKSIFKAFGITNSLGVSFTLRKAVSDETGQVTPHVYVMRGIIKGLEPSAVKVGEKGNNKVMLSLTYYKHTIGFEEQVEIDIPNMVRKFGGVDMQEAVRRAIGI